MVEFSQENDMAASGSDATATYHTVDGTDYMYVWLGRSGDQGTVVRYNLNDFSSEIVTSSADLAFNQGKVFRPDADSYPNRVYVTPRWYDNDETPPIPADTSVIIDISESGLSYTEVESFGNPHHNPMFGFVDGQGYWWGGQEKDGSSTPPVNQNIYAVSADGTTSISGTLDNEFYNAAAGFLEGTLYQFGGQVNGSTVSDIYTIDPTAGETFQTNMTKDGSDFAIRTHFGRFFGGNFYSFGGTTGDGNRNSEVWQIDPDSGEVSVLANMAQPLEDVITGFDGSQLWSFGGYDGGNYSDVYRIVRTKSDQVLLVREDLSLRGVFPAVGDDALLHDLEHSRAELGLRVGSEVVVVSEDFAQG